ncbi:MAG: TrkH family potassium uptake protein [Enterocloster sp.]
MAGIRNCSNCGKLMLLIGILVAAPLMVLPFYPNEKDYFMSFAIPALVSILMGSGSCIFGKREVSYHSNRQDALQRSSLTVLFAWFWGISIGAAPFVLSGQLSLIQALFESVSGWTTTGLSVMDVSQTSHIFLFHRSFMQYCGGLGFVMMMVMLVSGKHSMDLFNAEGHPDKLMPNLKKTAQMIFAIYSIFLVIGTILYTAVGMNLFDGICHAMCALSTGGFSTKLNSIGEYNSLSAEIITIILMLIGTTNFAVLLLLVRRRWRQLSQVSEVRFMLGLLLVCIPPVALSLAHGLHISIAEGFRHAFFDIISALSTTGYSTMGYGQWPPFAVGIMILMMLVGGGLGSTAGGLKLTRVYLILRMIGMNIKKRIFPRCSVEVPYFIKAQGKTRIDDELCADTVGFTGCYLLLFAAGSMLLTVTEDCGLTEAMFEFSSALGTVGLSIGLTGTGAGAGTLLVEMAGMILGRLEIFIVLIGVYAGIRMIRRK